MLSLDAEALPMPTVMLTTSETGMRWMVDILRCGWASAVRMWQVRLQAEIVA